MSQDKAKLLSMLFERLDAAGRIERSKRELAKLPARVDIAQRIARAREKNREPNRSQPPKRPQLVRRTRGALRNLDALRDALLQVLGERLVDITDFLASRLLALDDRASELAAFVEGYHQAHGRLATLKVLVHHNLLLDGTLLSLIEPLLSRAASPTTAPADAPELPPQAVDRGRQTLATLLCELIRLDEPSLPSLETQEARLSALRESPFPQQCPQLWRWFSTPSEASEDRDFLLGAYLIFIQAFAMRASVRSLAELALAERAQPHHLQADPKPEDED